MWRGSGRLRDPHTFRCGEPLPGLVGSTLTRGADGAPMRVLYLDSEGLGAVGCDAQHEMRIFSLAVLLGSLFLYNSRGPLDEASLTSLSFITQLAKHVRGPLLCGLAARTLRSRPFLAQFHAIWLPRYTSRPPAPPALKTLSMRSLPSCGCCAILLCS